VSVQPARQEDTMTVALVTFSKSGTRREFAIKNGTTVIGRKTDADLRIPLNEISRSHCELTVTDDEAILRDLDSSNGTFLNDEEISESPIKAGDRIRLGPVVFVVQIDGEPKDISAPPAAPAAVPKAADDAPSDSATAISSSSPADGSGFDIDTIDEDLDIDELSDLDLDLDEIDDLEDSGELEEIDELEELSDEDLSENQES